MKETRERQRITHDTVTVGERTFTVTFKTDGLHIREKYQRGGDKIISLQSLVSLKGNPTKANPDMKSGSPAESLDVAACDLASIAAQVGDKTITKSAVIEAKQSVLEALKIIRSLEVTADE